MKHAYLFDIDGVLCEPQQPCAPDIIEKLLSLSKEHNHIYLVTGNSFTKSVDLIGMPFFPVFCNNADELRGATGHLAWQDTETPPLPDMGWHLCDWSYAVSCDQNNTIEWRSPRFVNFSPTGRYASVEQRNAALLDWRPQFISATKKKFDVECVIGGQVSVDIYSKGADKSRAGKWLNDNGYTFTFFGDKTAPGGNDYPLAQYCEAHPENKCLTSTGPKHTLELIDLELRNERKD